MTTDTTQMTATWPRWPRSPPALDRRSADDSGDAQSPYICIHWTFEHRLTTTRHYGKPWTCYIRSDTKARRSDNIFYQVRGNQRAIIRPYGKLIGQSLLRSCFCTSASVTLCFHVGLIVLSILPTSNFFKSHALIPSLFTQNTEWNPSHHQSFCCSSYL